MPAGEYTIGMIVDTGEAVPETLETDNVAVDSANKLTILE
jgi:hypothetical protein